MTNLTTALLAASLMTAGERYVTYEITLQDPIGTEKQNVTLHVGEHPWRLEMAAGDVEIVSPAEEGGQSEIRLYAKGTRTLLHTARLGPRKEPVHVAYIVCGKTVVFQSPTPEKLRGCEQVADVR